MRNNRTRERVVMVGWRVRRVSVLKKKIVLVAASWQQEPWCHLVVVVASRGGSGGVVLTHARPLMGKSEWWRGDLV